MKRDEIDTDPSSPQSRRGSTDPGLGPNGRPQASTNGAATPATGLPAVADSIDEILEGITNRPRVDSIPTPRSTPQSAGEAMAAYQANARAPNPATTNPAPKPAVILSPSVETAALGERVPSSPQRVVVREASARPPAYAAPPAMRIEVQARDGRPRDVDTVLTPSARFKRFLRRAVLTAVVLSIALLVVATWKKGRPQRAAGAASAAQVTQASEVTEIAPAMTVTNTPPAAAAAPRSAPTGPTAPSTPLAANASNKPAPAAPTAAARTSASSGARVGANVATIATSGATSGSAPEPPLRATANASASARAAPAATKPSSGLDRGSKAPPPAPGFDEFKKSFTP